MLPHSPLTIENYAILVPLGRAQLAILGVKVTHPYKTIVIPIISRRYKSRHLSQIDTPRLSDSYF